jgi:hypothetical protein
MTTPAINLNYTGDLTESPSLAVEAAMNNVTTEELRGFELAAEALAQTETPAQSLDRVLPHPGAAQRVIDRIAQICPQGDDCVKPVGNEGRIFECDHCDFRGCIACLILHEEAGHEEQPRIPA